MRVQVKVWEGNREVEISSELELDFEVDVSEEEFGALVQKLSVDLVQIMYKFLKRKSQKIIVAPSVLVK